MFRITARDQRPEDLLGLATFSFSLPSIDYGDRRKAIFGEIAGTGSWNQFQQDGTVNTDMFSTLVNHHEIQPMILEEFAYYQYHLREKNSQSNRGWGPIWSTSLRLLVPSSSTCTYHLYPTLEDN